LFRLDFQLRILNANMNLFDLDKNLFFLINHDLSNVIFDIFMPVLTSKGYLLLLPYMIYIIWKGLKNNSRDADFNLKTALGAILVSFCSFLLADWLSHEIKHVIARERPCNFLEGVRLLIGCTKSYSMPSNHASNSFAVAFALFYFIRKHLSAMWKFYPFLLAILIAFSRVYVGVHYPSDVITGALFGGTVSFLLIYSYKYASTAYKTQPHTTVLAVALTAISIFRIYYILHGPLDLSPDEAHYWEWSRRLDLSYYSKGPVIAYLIYIGTSIFGDTVFGIRIMAVIFSVLSSIYMFKLTNLIYKDVSIAVYSAILLQIIPLFSTFGVIFTIDSPFIFFWIFSLFLFYRTVNPELQNQNPKLTTWLVLGISIGLGLLTKYLMAFFYICAFLFLLLSEKRYLLKTIKPYAALLVSLAVFSPVIIWNLQHDWVTLRHTAGQTHIYQGIQISLKSFFEFLGSQIGIITPVIFVMMFYTLFKSNPLTSSFQSKFLFYFSVPVIAFFLLKAFQGKVQANWAMTGYITGIIAFSRHFLRADYFALNKERRIKTKKTIVLAGIGLALLLTIISHYPSIIKLQPKLDPSARLRGWNTLGAEVSKIYESISNRGDVLIFSDSYQVSSEMAFYVKGKPKTYCINLGRRMNQYDLWPDMNDYAAKIRQNKEKNINGIFVKTGDAEIPADLSKSFDRFEKRILKVYDRGYLLREYSIFICYNFRGLKIQKPETF
jgi:undecaprenyl-diphosphatase